jgi:hypothetical protein
MPIVVKGLEKCLGLHPLPPKGVRANGVTLTIHDNDIVTIEKTDNCPNFTILRGSLLGMELNNVVITEDEKDSFEVITFFLPQKLAQTILCPKGTFKRLKNEVFQM